MDNLDAPSSNQTGANGLQAQYESLRHLVISMLILLVVISGTLNIYLLRQWRTTSKDLKAIRPQAAQMINEYQKVTQPRVNDFIKKLTEYARTNPDFMPILTKYGIKPGGATGAPPAGAKSAPPPTAPKK